MIYAGSHGEVPETTHSHSLQQQQQYQQQLQQHQYLQQQAQDQTLLPQHQVVNGRVMNVPAVLDFLTKRMYETTDPATINRLRQEIPQSDEARNYLPPGQDPVLVVMRRKVIAIWQTLTPHSQLQQAMLAPDGIINSYDQQPQYDQQPLQQQQQAQGQTLSQYQAINGKVINVPVVLNFITERMYKTSDPAVLNRLRQEILQSEDSSRLRPGEDPVLMIIRRKVIALWQTLPPNSQLQQAMLAPGGIINQHDQQPQSLQQQAQGQTQGQTLPQYQVINGKVINVPGVLSFITEHLYITSDPATINRLRQEVLQSEDSSCLQSGLDPVLPLLQRKAITMWQNLSPYMQLQQAMIAPNGIINSHEIPSSSIPSSKD